MLLTLELLAWLQWYRRQPMLLHAVWPLALPWDPLRCSACHLVLPRFCCPRSADSWAGWCQTHCRKGLGGNTELEHLVSSTLRISFCKRAVQGGLGWEHQPGGAMGTLFFAAAFEGFRPSFFSLFFSILSFNSLCFAIIQHCYTLTRRDQILDSGPVLDQFWISHSLYIFIVIFFFEEFYSFILGTHWYQETQSNWASFYSVEGSPWRKVDPT